MWLKNKKATTNPKNHDDKKYFQGVESNIELSKNQTDPK